MNSELLFEKITGSIFPYIGKMDLVGFLALCAIGTVLLILAVQILVRVRGGSRHLALRCSLDMLWASLWAMTLVGLPVAIVLSGRSISRAFVSDKDQSYIGPHDE